MRLLNVNSRELVEVVGEGVPRYAILSHTWGTDEVLFADMGDPEAKKKSGWGKIESSCQQASKDGFEWIWIDT